MNHNLDATDIKLLTLLQEDGRRSNADLAGQVGLSPSACLRRLQQLEHQGVIAGYRAELDPKRINLGLEAFVRVTMGKNSPEALQQFIDEVGQWEQVVACYWMTGDSDYLLHVVVEDLDAYAKFLGGRLLNAAPLANVNSSLVLGTVKREGALPLRHLTAKA